MKQFLIFLLLDVFILFLGCEAQEVRLEKDNWTAGSDSDTDSDMDTDSDADTNSDTDSDTIFDECAELTETSNIERIPADIVIAVDNSGSMKAEAQMVQDSMNDFSLQITASGIDAHVILISGDSTYDKGICVDFPLGSGSCPEDSNPATNYLHSPHYISSTLPLNRICSTYDHYANHWKEMIRKEAILHFIVVSDDNSGWTITEFTECLAGLDPPILDFTFHAIVSSEENIAGGPCEGLSAHEGTVYKGLAAATGGVLGDLCQQEFQPVFDKVATEVGKASMDCQWDIPAPPNNEKLDPKKVNVDFVDDLGKPNHIGHVGSKGDCSGVVHGWYYDNPQSPTMVNICDQTCNWIQGQADAKIQIIFGCETREAIVI